MSKPTIKLLESGYWHVRWNSNLWFQWPKDRSPEIADGFGWVTEADRMKAEALAEGAGA